MQFPASIFKAYDIRGLVLNELSQDLAFRIGRAFVHFLRENGVDTTTGAIVVGRDMRETSPGFQEAVIQGVLHEGVHVVDIGLTSTPLFNFACAHYSEHLGGIMVTASHNPAAYNGFKLTLGDGIPVGKNNGMTRMYELANSLEAGTSVDGGTRTEKTVLGDYLERLFSLVPIGSIQPLNIVVDGGNGMANVTIPRMLKALPVTVEYLYMDPDGNFPNHEANPLKTETLKDLQELVKAVGADFGFALDGDADRVGLVDERGNVVAASCVGALVGREVLRQHPSGLCLYDLRSSSIVPEVWEQAGATTDMCMVGHALIKKMMKEKGAVFASELSLHLYYQDMYNAESSDLSLLYILQLLSREKKPLSTLVEPLKKYAHSGEINFEVHDKAAVLERIEKKYAPTAMTVTHLDGLWMKFDWGWVSVRESNTEPVLRLNLETRDPATTQEKVDEFKKIISS